MKPDKKPLSVLLADYVKAKEREKARKERKSSHWIGHTVEAYMYYQSRRARHIMRN